MRSDREKLLDISEAIANIEKYSSAGRAAFAADELIRTYVVHQLQIIGEAAGKLSPAFRTAHPEIPWPKMMGMRHILVHDYFRVDPDMVWGVTQTDLPPLKLQIQAILQQMEPPA